MAVGVWHGECGAPSGRRGIWEQRSFGGPIPVLLSWASIPYWQLASTAARLDARARGFMSSCAALSRRRTRSPSCWKSGLRRWWCGTLVREQGADSRSEGRVSPRNAACCIAVINDLGLAPSLRTLGVTVWPTMRRTSVPRPPKQPMKCDFTDPADIAAWQESVRRRTGDPVPDEFDLGQLFGSLAVSPQACAIANQMGMFVRDAGERENTYTHAQRELVDQVLARDWNMNHVQVMHIKDAISAGVRMEAIKALRYHHEEDLDEEERLLVNFIRRVVTRSVDNETWNAVEQLMGRVASSSTRFSCCGCSGSSVGSRRSISLNHPMPRSTSSSQISTPAPWPPATTASASRASCTPDTTADGEVRGTRRGRELLRVPEQQ